MVYLLSWGIRLLHRKQWILVFVFLISRGSFAADVSLDSCPLAIALHTVVTGIQPEGTKGPSLPGTVFRIISKKERAGNPTLVAKIRIDTSGEHAHASSTGIAIFKEALEPFLEANGVAKTRIKGFKQAMLEAIQNGDEWGNRRQIGRWLILRVFYAPEVSLSVAIQDQGEGYDPNNLPHAASEENPFGNHMEIRKEMGIRVEGGYGLLLARGMAQLDWNQRRREATVKILLHEPVPAERELVGAGAP
jgi:anti-sigma regulatory factor (Ser/Thr protein kinase)